MGRRNSDGAGFLPRKTKMKLNAPPKNQPWVWFSFEMLESGAMRSLSVNGLRVLHRIQIEHMAHGGLENGRLKVTWLDFEKFGVSRKRIRKSIDETIAAGLIAIEQRGRRAHGEDRGDPTQYRLTYLPVADPETIALPRMSRSDSRATPAPRVMQSRPRPPASPAMVKLKPILKLGPCRRKFFSSGVTVAPMSSPTVAPDIRSHSG
jgi:hypothetical protein